MMKIQEFWKHLQVNIYQIQQNFWNMKKIKIYGIDLSDFHEVFDEQFFEMLDVFDLKQKVIYLVLKL